MEACYRKEFDDRAGWVETQHVTEHNVCVSFQTLRLGPGQYSPNLRTRNISTPLLGKLPVQKNFLQTPLRKSKSIKDSFSAEVTKSNLVTSHLGPNINERSEFTTVFHGYEERMPIDPNRRFCVTPGPRLTHDSMLETTCSDGKKLSKTFRFGSSDVPFGDRNDIKVALPEYDTSIVSEHLKPRLKLGIVPQAARFSYQLPESSTPTTTKAKNESKIDATTYAHTPKNAIKIPMPKINLRPQLVTTFDSTSYNKTKKPSLSQLNPAAVSKCAKVHMFDNAFNIPRIHATRHLQSRVSDTLKQCGGLDDEYS